MLLPNRNAIITGGSRGMGRAIALKFAEEGCSSMIADVLDAEARKTTEELSQRGSKAFFAHCDVSDDRQVQAMVDEAISKLGKIDILVNCAGVGSNPKYINDISNEEWDRVLNINLKGVFFCCRAIVPHMKENKEGKIINVASLAAFAPPGIMVHYSASKGGVMTLTTGLALEMAPFNVRVNAILPGFIRTDMVADFSGVADIEAVCANLAKIAPMKKVGTPEDIANTALYLASDLSSYVTAGGVIVGGGMPWGGIG
jgi:3-oxoacyl-[acyl-carrier protein] reductase